MEIEIFVKNEDSVKKIGRPQEKKISMLEDCVI
jgi:hypothetical protein